MGLSHGVKERKECHPNWLGASRSLCQDAKRFPAGIMFDYFLSCHGKSAKDPAVAKFP